MSSPIKCGHMVAVVPVFSESPSRPHRNVILDKVLYDIHSLEVLLEYFSDHWFAWTMGICLVVCGGTDNRRY